MARERLRSIDDGYTEDGFVRAQEGIFDKGVSFLFRPLTLVQQQRLEVEQSKLERKGDVEGSIRIQATAVAQQIKEWDYTRPNGEEVKISVENLMKMKPRLYKSIAMIVCGYEGSDAGDEPHREAANDAAALSRIFGGEAATTEDVNAKNSVTG